MAAVHFYPGLSPLKDSTGNSRISYDINGIAFNGQTPVARPDFTVSNHTDDRALNETADTLVQLANVVGTLINDLIAVGILQ